VQTPTFLSPLFGNKRFQLSLWKVVLLGSLLLLLIGSVNLSSFIHNNAVRLQAVATATVVATLHLQAVATAASAKSAYERGVSRQELMVGFDASHSNYNPYEHVLNPTSVSQLQLSWAKNISAQMLEGGPIVVNNIIYVSSFDKKLRALDVSTGEIVAFYPTNGIINTSPTFANGTIYIGSWDGTFHALKAQTLDPIWSYPTPQQERVEGSSTFANGTIYIGADDSKLYAFDAVTKKMRWFFQTGSLVRSAPAVVGDTVYYNGPIIMDP
jgi:outer membrane protein assembly factor BamB